MSRYTPRSYDRPARSHDYSRNTRATDVSTRSYESPTRSSDVSARSYNSPSRIGLPRSGQSSRSSSVSSSVSEVSGRGEAKSTSSHAPLSQSQSARNQSDLVSSPLRRSLRNTSGEASDRRDTLSEFAARRSLRQSGRNERGESSTARTETRTQSPTADRLGTRVTSSPGADQDRCRFGFGSNRKSSREQDENLSAKNDTGSKGSEDAAGRFGGVVLRKSLRDKPDSKLNEDLYKFRSAVARSSLRNSRGDEIEGKTGEIQSVPLLRKTHQTTLVELSDSQPVQLRGREIQKIGTSQVTSRVESISNKVGETRENEDRFGGGNLRRSLRETNGDVKRDSEKGTRESAAERFGLRRSLRNNSGMQSEKTKAVGPDPNAARSVESRTSTRQYGGAVVGGTQKKVDEKNTEKDSFGSSILRRRIQQYAGHSKSAGVVKDLPTEGSQSEDLSTDGPQKVTSSFTPARSLDDDSLQINEEQSLPQTKSGHGAKTPADDFLRRAELRSSLRQHNREVTTSAVQTLSGDVFKRSSLRHTLPLRKETSSSGSEGTLGRSEQQPSLCLQWESDVGGSALPSDTAGGNREPAPTCKEPTKSVGHVWEARPKDQAVGPKDQEGRPKKNDVRVDDQKVMPNEPAQDPESSVPRQKVMLDANSTDQFGRPAWRKALRGRGDKTDSLNKDRIQSGDSLSKDRSQSSDNLSRDRLPSGDSLSKDRSPSGVSLNKERTPSGDSLKKVSEISPLTRSETNLTAKSETTLTHTGKSVDESHSHSMVTRSRIPKPNEGEEPKSPKKRETVEADTASRPMQQRVPDTFRTDSMALSPPSDRARLNMPDTPHVNVGLPQTANIPPQMLPFESREIHSGEPVTPAGKLDLSTADNNAETPAELRAKRIQQYKEERRRQLSYLSEKFQDTGLSMPKLFTQSTNQEESKEEKSKDGYVPQLSPPVPVVTKMGEEKMIDTGPQAESQSLKSEKASLMREAVPMESPFKRQRPEEDEKFSVEELRSKRQKSEEKQLGKHTGVPANQNAKSQEKAPVTKKLPDVKIQSPSGQLQRKHPGSKVTVQPSSPLKTENTGPELKMKVSLANLPRGFLAGTEARGMKSPEEIITQAKPGLDTDRQTSLEETSSKKESRSESLRDEGKHDPQSKETTAKTVQPELSRSKGDLKKGVPSAVVPREKGVPMTEVSSKKGVQLVEVSQKDGVPLGEVSQKKVQLTDTPQKEVDPLRPHVSQKKEVPLGELSQKKEVPLRQHVSQKKEVLSELSQKKEVPFGTHVSQKKGLPLEDVCQKKEVPLDEFPQKKDMPLGSQASQKKEVMSGSHVSQKMREELTPEPQFATLRFTLKEEFVQMPAEAQKALDAEISLFARNSVSPVAVETSEPSKGQIVHAKLMENRKIAEVKPFRHGEIHSEEADTHTAELPRPTQSHLQARWPGERPPAAEPAGPLKACEAKSKETIVQPITPARKITPETVMSPDSPDNLDELLRRNQKYLEDEVKKKLTRQQHVASSSSEAEKAANEQAGSLAPPEGVKKKRISPLMRRRMKERSKSRERTEAELQKSRENSQSNSPTEELELAAKVVEQAENILPIDGARLESQKQQESDSTLTSLTESVSVSAAGSEDHGKKKRKDKSSTRKSQLNQPDPATSIKGIDDISLQATTPRGQRSPSRTKTTPVTPEEVQQATDNIARQRAAEAKVSQAVSRFQIEDQATKTESHGQGSRTSTGPEEQTKVSKKIARGKDFSALIAQFSSSSTSERSDTEASRTRITTTRRFDFPPAFPRGGPTSSSDESNTECARPRRTPERTGSLKERARKFEVEGTGSKSVQRSASFKSSFMRRVRPSQTDQASEELAEVLKRRSKGFDDHEEQKKKTELSEAEKRIHLLEAKLTPGNEETKVEEVIKDAELANVLNARRKNSDTSHQVSEISPYDAVPSQKTNIRETKVEEIIADKEVVEVLKARRKDVDAYLVEDTDLLKEKVEPHEKVDKQKEVFPEIIGLKGDNHLADENKESKVADKLQSETKSEGERADRTKSLDMYVQPDSTGHSPTDARTSDNGTSKSTVNGLHNKQNGTQEIQILTKSSDAPVLSIVPNLDNVTRRRRQDGHKNEPRSVSNTKADDVKSTSENKNDNAPMRPVSASGAIEQQDSLEKPVRSILKRSSSAASDFGRPKSMVSSGVVDPQLAAVLLARRQSVEKDVNDSDTGGEDVDRRELIRQEIASTAIHPGQEEGEEEVTTRPRSIAERIFLMENRIEEAKSCPVTPRSRSGLTTPRSRTRSGASTPKRQESLESLEEEGKSSQATSLMSDKQLIAKLEKVAEKEERSSDKRQKFQRRSRDDWRTRTLPVTIEEIQEADSLESVSSFRALVRRQATINIFEHIKEQDKKVIYSQKTEFPQPYRRDKKARRSGRFKTAPITAAELGSIPEGNALLDPLRHKVQTLSAATSKTDSGILSGSDGESHMSRDSVQSDSLRSLEMEAEDDPTRLSVSARASIFKQLEEDAKLPEKPKPRSIGAKRMIEKKKRERSLTQPVTEDEVKTASGMAESMEQESSCDNVVRSGRTKGDNSSDSDDDLSRLSLADKLKLFSQKPAEKPPQPPSRSDAPVIRRRNRKQVSRFNTQPITPEEVEKASRISPLAMSLVKPPDNELLRSLPIAAQIEMMAQHAEVCLSQSSSRAGSRAGSQPSSRRSSFGADSADTEEVNDDGILKTSEHKDSQEVRSILKPDGRKSSDAEIRGILKADGVGEKSTEPRGILKHADSAGELETLPKSPEEPSRGILKHAESPSRGIKSALRKDAKGKSEGDLPRSILKRDSLEDFKVEPDKGVLKKSKSQEFKDSHELRGILKKSSSTEVTSEEFIIVQHDQEEVRIETEEVTTQEAEGDLDGDESEFSTTVTVEVQNDSTVDTPKTSRIKNEAVARRRSRKEAEAERYLTQPADVGGSEKTPEQRKMKYGAARHHTQPITPEEKQAAEGSSEMNGKLTGSIADRLNLLKKSGEEGWKKRVGKIDFDASDVKLREKKDTPLDRPNSIAERLNLLGESQHRWTARVEEKDAKAFTVEGKQSKTGAVPLDSPLAARKRRLPKRELSFGKADSGGSSEGTPLPSPSIEKIPLPTELISEGPPVTDVSTSSTSVVTTTMSAEVNSETEVIKRTTVEVPTLGDEELEILFSTTSLSEQSAEKVEVSVDDFNQLFLEAEDILMATRRIRPKRRHHAQNRNPLKTMSVEIQQEYIEEKTGVAEMELKRIKRQNITKDASSAQIMLAEAAVKGLQSKESFNIELRKTKDTKPVTASGADRHNPFNDVMLLQVKGRRHVQARLVEPVAASVNSGDCYVLVTPDKVINWIGKFSNVIEKAKSADIALFISQKKDMGYRAAAAAVTVEEEKQHLAGRNFWTALGGQGEYEDGGPPDEDEDYEVYMVETNMIYQVYNNTLVPLKEYWGRIPRVEMLKTNEVLVFDYGSELYVWHGQRVSMEQRKMGMKLAKQLWEKGYDYSMCPINPVSPLRDEDVGGPSKKASKRPSWAIFGKVNQNMETTLFKEKFSDWPDSSRFTIRSKTPESFIGKADGGDLQPYDARLLIPVNTAPVTMMFEGSHVGRGDKWVEEMDGLRREFDILTLGVNVWHVLEYDHSKLPDHSYGQFHDGDTYVVRWQYMITAAGMKNLKGHAARRSLTGRERCAYFFWQGHNSTVNEKGASALMTVELDEERGPQVRVLQGKEPPCFLNLFEGKFIIHIGKREDAETNTQGSYRFYVVRNEYEKETCLMEIPVGTKNLRSRSSFLLLNIRTGLLYIWHGSKSPTHTRKLSLAAANKLKQKCPLEVGLHSSANIVITELEEGSEKSEFWSAMGDRDRNLYHSLRKDDRDFRYTPRLFYMNSVAGIFEAVEVLNPSRTPDLNSSMPFPQSDLYKVSQPGLFLLDHCHEVYLWQGWWPEGGEESDNVHTGSAQARFNTDRRCAMETTIQYCREMNKEHPPKAYLVFAGVEPLAFTNLFPFWEIDPEAEEVSLREGRKQGETIDVDVVLAKLTQSQYTMDELQERPLPEGVDPLKLETYLPEDEFEEVLNMTKDEFYALPHWKQRKLKVKVGLF